jgi:ankyrin repeat protein
MSTETTAGEAAKKETFVITGLSPFILGEFSDYFDKADGSLCADVSATDECLDALRRVMNASDEYKEGDENIKIGKTRRPFHLAAAVGNNKYLAKTPESALLEICSGVDDQANVVAWAIMGNNVAGLRLLREKLGKDKFWARTKQGWSLAHWAADAGALASMRYLVEDVGKEDNEETLNARADKDEACVLSLACASAALPVVRYLLEEQTVGKVRLDLRTRIGDAAKPTGTRTAWTTACAVSSSRTEISSETCLEVLRLLFKHGAHRDSLREAQECGGKVTFVPLKLEDRERTADTGRVFAKMRFFPVLPGSAMGETMLRTTLAKAEEDKGKAGLAAPSSPGQRAALARAAPCSAADRELHDERIYYLASGMKRDRSNGPLHAACRSGRVELVKFLVEEAGFRADLDATLGVMTPIVETVVDAPRGGPDVLRYLILDENGPKCSPDSKSSRGMCLVYAAARAGKAEALRVLIEAGANQNVMYAQAAPFYAAVEQNQLECVEIMLKSKRCDTTCTFYGRTLLGCARERKLPEMVALLEKYGVA